MILIIPILIGIAGLILFNYFSSYLIHQLLSWEWIGDIAPTNEELPNIIGLLVLVVIVEEILFRRIIAQIVYNQKGTSKAIWVSALAFSIAHMFGEIGLLYAFLGGLLFGYIYIKTRNLWMTLFTHLIYNLTILFIVPKISDRVSSFNSLYSIGIITLSIGLILTMIWILNYFLNEKTKKPAYNNA